LKGYRKPPREQGTYRLPVPETVAKISLKNIAYPDKVLPGKALIQMVLASQERTGFVADPPPAGDGTHGIGWGKPDKEKNKRRHYKKHRNKEEKSFNDIVNY
jgi:hypothetical protein